MRICSSSAGSDAEEEEEEEEDEEEEAEAAAEAVPFLSDFFLAAADDMLMRGLCVCVFERL